MTKCNLPEVVVTGVGVTASIGQGKEDFASSLLSGRHAFDVMKRSGRQKDSRFIGAEIASLSYPDRLSKKMLRKASFSSRAALVTLTEAWEEAELDDADSHVSDWLLADQIFNREKTLKFMKGIKTAPVLFLRRMVCLSWTAIFAGYVQISLASRD